MPAPRSLLQRLWLICSGAPAAALLSGLGALALAIAARFPQGEEARVWLSAGRDPSLEWAAAWGLTDLSASPIAWALGLLLGLNLLALIARAALDRWTPPPAGSATEDARLTAEAPEWAVEQVEAALGAPQQESVEGAKVSLFYARGGVARWAAPIAQAGVILCLLGGVWALSPPGADGRLARLEVDVIHRQSGASSRFELREGERTQLFQADHRYTLLGFLPNRQGLGPASLIQEQTLGEDEQITAQRRFWLYADAPAGFDQRHRVDVLSLRPVEMGWAARPGAGLGASLAGVWMSLGFGLMLAGWAAASARPAWIWVAIDGAEVHLRGASVFEDDPSFALSFARLSQSLRSNLEEGKA